MAMTRLPSCPTEGDDVQSRPAAAAGDDQMGRRRRAVDEAQRARERSPLQVSCAALGARVELAEAPADAGAAGMQSCEQVLRRLRRVAAGERQVGEAGAEQRRRAGGAAEFLHRQRQLAQAAFARARCRGRRGPGSASCDQTAATAVRLAAAGDRLRRPASARRESRAASRAAASAPRRRAAPRHRGRVGPSCARPAERALGAQARRGRRRRGRGRRAAPPRCARRGRRRSAAPPSAWPTSGRARWPPCSPRRPRRSRRRGPAPRTAGRPSPRRRCGSASTARRPS